MKTTWKRTETYNASAVSPRLLKANAFGDVGSKQLTTELSKKKVIWCLSAASHWKTALKAV